MSKQNEARAWSPSAAREAARADCAADIARYGLGSGAAADLAALLSGDHAWFDSPNSARSLCITVNCDMPATMAYLEGFP